MTTLHPQISGFKGTVYAVGDIHGSLDALLALEDTIRRDVATLGGPALIVHLGDYVDRGPDSAGVLDHFTQDQGGIQHVFLKGNHEEMMTSFLAFPSPDHEWLRVGGIETLVSYGIAARDLRLMNLAELRALLARAIPAAHLAFLANFALTLRVNNCLFVHAGIRDGIPVEDQSERDLLWMRRPEGERIGPDMPVVVHGHTIIETPKVVGRRICVDTGAYLTGRLTAARIDARGVAFLST